MCNSFSPLPITLGLEKRVLQVYGTHQRILQRVFHYECRSHNYACFEQSQGLSKHKRCLPMDRLLLQHLQSYL